MTEENVAGYYDFVRKEIEPLLPPWSARVLEVGCGNGGTLAWLRESGRAGWLAGVEMSSTAAEKARSRIDLLREGDVNRICSEFAPASFDLILCLDVLEHLVDPWTTLGRLQALLRPEGELIVSLPNIRHHSVLLPLLLSGRWRYEPAGIMDQSHLRFFSRQTALTMVRDAGFEIRQLHCTYVGRDALKDRLSCGLLRDFFAFQYLISARKQQAPYCFLKDAA